MPFWWNQYDLKVPTTWHEYLQNTNLNLNATLKYHEINHKIICIGNLMIHDFKIKIVCLGSRTHNCKIESISCLRRPHRQKVRQWTQKVYRLYQTDKRTICLINRYIPFRELFLTCIPTYNRLWYFIYQSIFL